MFLTITAWGNEAFFGADTRDTNFNDAGLSEAVFTSEQKQKIEREQDSILEGRGRIKKWKTKQQE